jgi:hypothetical protein
MKQQKFFVGDVVKRTKWLTPHKAATGNPITITSVEYDEEQDVWWLGFYGDPAEREDTCYTIIERAWQENDGDYSANNAPVDEDTYIEILFNGATTPSIVTVEKEWWENTKGMVKWRIADEYENPKEFFEQEQSANSVCPPEAQPPVHVALGEELAAVDVQKKNKYTREIKPNVFVDVYDVLRAFNVTDPCLSHLAKKALAAGQRHHKDRLTDLQDIKASIERAIEMHKEWN